MCTVPIAKCHQSQLFRKLDIQESNLRLAKQKELVESLKILVSFEYSLNELFLTILSPSADSSLHCCIPIRYVVTFMAFTGFFNVYAMRVNLSVALVAMVNSSTETPHTNYSNDCPIIGNQTKDSKVCLRAKLFYSYLAYLRFLTFWFLQFVSMPLSFLLGCMQCKLICTGIPVLMWPFIHSEQIPFHVFTHCRVLLVDFLKAPLSQTHEIIIKIFLLCQPQYLHVLGLIQELLKELFHFDAIVTFSLISC